MVKYLMNLNPRLAAVYDNRAPFGEKIFLIDTDPSSDLRRASLPCRENFASLAQSAGPSRSAPLLLIRSHWSPQSYTPSVLSSGSLC